YPDIVVVRGNRDENLQFLRRTSHGKAYMSFPEVELHQMKTARAVKLAFAKAQHTLANSTSSSGLVELVPSPGIVSRIMPWTSVVPAPGVNVRLGEIGERVLTLRFEHDQHEARVRLPFT